MKTMFSQHVALKESHKTAPLAKKINDINKNELVTVTIRVKAKNKMPDLLNPILNKDFKIMSRDEFEQTFGADPGDLQKIEEFANHFGLTIVSSDTNQRSIDLQGSISRMEDAFKVELSIYGDETGKRFRGRKGEIHIPQELDGIIEGVFGLDNRSVATAKYQILSEDHPAFKHHTLTGNGAFNPNQLAKIYNYPTDATGKNQCIGIIELGGGYRNEDLTAYFTGLGMNTPKVVAVSVDHGQNNPSNPNGDDGEVMLDIEVAAAIAPDATIVVYFAKNTDKGFLDAINAAIHDTHYNPSIISISWGSAEISWTRQSLKAFNQTFQAAATMGITVCAAAGDTGSSDGVADGKVHVDFPASSPYVLACGGTKLVVNNSGTRQEEVVWHESNDSATGGGVSDVFPLPPYQVAAHIPVAIDSNNHGRGVPDIAADADPITGYNILVDGRRMIIGGTSAVAPLTAGLIAMINQKLNKKVGFINPKIYSHPNVCWDVTQGDNITTLGYKGYQATIGWDACCGNGVLNGMSLMSIL
jgi:kumamolisin